jgi:hypothetical protein
MKASEYTNAARCLSATEACQAFTNFTESPVALPFRRILLLDLDFSISFWALAIH